MLAYTILSIMAGVSGHTMTVTSQVNKGAISATELFPKTADDKILGNLAFGVV